MSEISDSAFALKILLLDKAQSDKKAALAYDDLSAILEAAINGSLVIPLSRVPRHHDFHEGDLRQYSDLENAYSKFSCLAKGLTTI